MKQIFTLFALALTTLFQGNAFAQFSHAFNVNNVSAITSNCWIVDQLEITNDPAFIIEGTGSLLSQPITSTNNTRLISTPWLNVTAGNLTVSFSYKLSSKLAGQATRIIEVGLTDANNYFTQLAVLNLNNNTSTNVLSFNQTFAITNAGLRRLTLRLSGDTGDGNSRLIIDNLSTSAAARYNNNQSNCNSAPVANNDVFSGVAGQPYSGNVALNDTDPDGETFTAALVTTSPDGTVNMSSNGSFTFTPNPGFSGGSTTFTYRLTDNGLPAAQSNVGTVTINFLASAPLPVKLISFTGNKNNNGRITLQWMVADNQDAEYYEIEKSNNGRDFSKVTMIVPTDKSGNEVYSFSETPSATGKLMYRLKLVDKSGVVDYSRIVVFAFDAVSAAQRLVINGNPAGDKVGFTYQTANKNIQVRVYDMNGRVYAQQVMLTMEGTNFLSIQLPAAGKGMYVLEVIDGATRYNAKFIR